MTEPTPSISNRFFHCPQGEKALPDYQPGAWLAAPPPRPPSASGGQHRPPEAHPAGGRGRPGDPRIATPKGAG